jgi:biopolymer transport protein ExbB
MNDLLQNELVQEMWRTWSNGGWVMAAMAVLAVILFASAIQLLMALHFRGITRASDPVLRGWVSRPDEAPARIRELIRYTQDEIHSAKDIEGRFREVEAAKVSELDRRLAFLNVMVIAAPLFGLLGTVLGMLLTFRAIGVGGSSTSEIIARGISEALVCTQSGMMVAIPGLIMANLAQRWRHEFVAFLVRLESLTLRCFRPEPPGAARPVVRPDAPAVETFSTNDVTEVVPA